ncbi:jg26117 [Pararge aegeria aegeria]|uniref:Jg26117 protein n=1 Tax=Pararge aegeria aegeria TaxID=348720 RepID=A0A8S4SC60_9NEOP|nr:jg26117 [Pararge aegeria aegeria]
MPGRVPAAPAPRRRRAALLRHAIVCKSTADSSLIAPYRVTNIQYPYTLVEGGGRSAEQYSELRAFVIRTTPRPESGCSVSLNPTWPHGADGNLSDG